MNPPTDKASYVIFFDSSLNGLDIGAPVKIQGVKVGEVKEIVLQIDPKDIRVFKPVVIEIDRKKLNNTTTMVFPQASDEEQRIVNRDNLVSAGFRARLEMQSLLTGLLYIDIDRHPDKPPLYANIPFQGLLELPGVPTATDEIRNTAVEMAKKLRVMPLEEIVLDFSETLKEIKNLLASDDTKKAKGALANTLVGLEKTVATLNLELGPILKDSRQTVQELEKVIGTLNRNLEPLLKDTHKTIQNTNALMQDSKVMVQDLHQEMKPILISTDKTLATATAALSKAQDSMNKVDDAIGPESALNDSLSALKDAARSIRELTDYLERHPEALLSGKND